MRRPWLVYLLTALIACAAGVAIAGLPSRSSGGAVAFVPVSTSTPTSPPTSTPAPTPAPTTRSSTTTEPSTPTTASPTTTAAPSTTTTTTTSEPPSTTTTAPPPPTTVGDDDPTDEPLNDVRIAVANGAGVSGLAGSAAEVLRSAGFEDVTATNTGPASASTVFFDGEELAAAAALIIDELGLPPGAVASRDAAPEIDETGDFDIIVVLGADRIP